MIPKAQILALAKAQQLRPTTVEKDYVIGWLLRAVSQHPTLSRWIFKGGTCLKKCFFETYRFSEDLDFTVAAADTLTVESISRGLSELGAWIERGCGLRFPLSDLKVEQYSNPRGHPSFQSKLAFAGPLGQAPRSLQRVKFDLTQDEVIADTPVLRDVHHGYDDAAEPAAQVLCYSINEVLAEKKFGFKGLPSPTVDGIVGGIDQGLLKANWDDQLGHQLPVLAPVDSFLGDLRDAVAWWLEPESASPPLPPNPHTTGPVVAAPRFPTLAWPIRPRHLEQIRYAARNRLCALVTYHGVQRLVEPYSLRHPATGNFVLHVEEVERGGHRSQSHKSFIVSEITAASVSPHPFTPRWLVEL